MLAPRYPVETERLLLRPLDPVADVDAVHAYAARADVCRYIPWQPRTRAEVASWLADPAAQAATMRAPGDNLRLAIVERSTNRLVGDIVLMWRPGEHRCAELGYVLNPDVHGRGYATEACRALLNLAFGALPLHRVIARVDARNTASAAVLRRLGMRQEAYLRENEWFKGEWTDEIDFAILEREWPSAQARA